MKLCVWFTVLLPCTCLASDVSIEINGAIAENGCVVASGSQYFTVDMRTVAAKSFHSPGVTSRAVPFSIQLLSCGALTNAVMVKFSGESYGNSGLLALSHDPNAAGGVGVQLLDRKMAPINLNQSGSLYELAARTDNTLDFYALYQAVSLPVRAGIANATVEFTLEYQ